VFKALNKTRGLYLRWRELSDTNGSTAEIEWTTTELRNALRSIEWDLEDLEDTIAIVEKNPNKFKIDNRELASRRNFIDATRDEVKSMKEKMSINRRTIDQDITARQPLLDSPTKATVIGGASNGINLPTSTNSNKLHHSLISQAGAVMAARHSSAKYSKLENQMDSPSHYAMGGSTPMGGGGTGTGFDSPSNRFLGETMSTQQRMMSTQDEQLDIISDSIGTLKTVSRQIGGELDEQAV
jgi:syntaxin 6